MKSDNMPEAMRIAMVLTVCHASMKEFLGIRRFAPPIVQELYLHSPAEISKGNLGAIALEFFFLYDKCAKAGLVDESSIDAAFLERMRETLKEMKEAGINLETQSAEATLKEMHTIMQHVCTDLNCRRPKMPTAEEAIERAKKHED